MSTLNSVISSHETATSTTKQTQLTICVLPKLRINWWRVRLYYYRTSESNIQVVDPFVSYNQ